MKIRNLVFIASMLASLCPIANAQVSVATRSYNNARTGANVAETAIRPGNVATLKKRFSLAIPDDPRIEAQPLYVHGLKLKDGSTHDAIIVCSMANTVYAFDGKTAAKLWSRTLGPDKPFLPAHTAGPTPTTSEIDLYGINTRWGILSTPVIDLDAQTMYLVTWSTPDGTTRNKLKHHLQAVDLRDGSEAHAPVVLEATAKTNVPTKTVSFVSSSQKQRSALLLVSLPSSGGAPKKKTLFIASGQFGEDAKSPFHGWVFAFDPDSLTKTASWCTTPNSGAGGIWQAAQGPAADENGDLFVMTSNGGWDGKTDFAESFVRLHYTPPAGSTRATLDVADWFTPYLDAPRNPKEMGTGYSFQDQDLGSGGPVVVPGTKLMLGAGKDGVVYVFDKANLGKKLATKLTDFDHLVQTPIFFTFFPGPGIDARDVKVLDKNYFGKTHHLHGSPISWNSPTRGQMLFCHGENECLRAWTIDATGKIAFVAKSTEIASEGSTRKLGGMPGGMLTLSCNGTKPGTGIIWSLAPIRGDANKEIAEGILRAYDATTLDTVPNADGSPRLKLLWDSKRVPGNTFSFSKFNLPVVADGKVIVPTYNGRVDVYGL